MRPQQDYRLLGTVIGAAIGALIGLAFVKYTLLGVPAGAVVGGIIGFVVASSQGSRSGYGMGVDGADVADAGCATLGCLWDLSWLGCIGCGTMLGALATGLLAGAIALLH